MQLLFNVQAMEMPFFDDRVGSDVKHIVITVLCFTTELAVPMRF